MRRAAARAASRRGSSTTMRRSASQGSSRRRGGTRVVFPAPGGATRTAEPKSCRARRSSKIVPSTGRSVRGIRSAERRCAGEGCGIAGSRDGRCRPRRRRRDRLGDRTPLDGRPALGDGGNGAIGPNEHEGGQGLKSEGAHGRTVRVGEDEEFTRERTEERSSLIGGRRDDETCACCRSAECPQDSSSRLEDPRALVRVRIENDCSQMKRRQPFTERSRPLVVGSLEDRFEHQISRRIGDHVVNGSGSLLTMNSQCHGRIGLTSSTSGWD